MKSNNLRTLGMSLALLGTAGFASVANAAPGDNTLAGTEVTNQAVVSFDVSGAPQAPIESAPGGNSVAGGGVDTVFVVDRKLDIFVLADTTSVAIPAGYQNTTTHPSTDAEGTLSHALIFDVTNQSNSVQDLSLTAFDNVLLDVDNGQADGFVTDTFRYFIDSNSNGGFDSGDLEISLANNPVVGHDGGVQVGGAYDGVRYLDAVAPGEIVRVFVVAKTEGPANATPGEFGHVTLISQIHESGVVGVNSTTGDNALGALSVADNDGDAASHHDDYQTVVDTSNNAAEIASQIDTIFVDSVSHKLGFADADYDVSLVAEKSDTNVEFVLDTAVPGVAGVATDAAGDGQYADTATYIIVGTTITVAKASTVISDPFNGDVSPMRIPGAVVRYTITVTNSGALDADSVTIVDQIPANTTYVPNSVIITGGVNAGTHVDGAGVATLLASPTRISVATGTVPKKAGAIDGEVIVSFDVTID